MVVSIPGYLRVNVVLGDDGHEAPNVALTSDRARHYNDIKVICAASRSPNKADCVLP